MALDGGVGAQGSSLSPTLLNIYVPPLAKVIR